MEPDDVQEFYREILITYRLLFGQHKGSYKAFNTVTQTSIPVPNKCADPLLPLLCGQSWTSKTSIKVYELIGAESPLRRLA
jgi:hypothetical protein